MRRKSQVHRKELDMIRSGGVFFVAATPSKSTLKEASTLELNPMTAAEVEQAALTDKGTRCVRNLGSPLQEPSWTVTTVCIRVPSNALS